MDNWFNLILISAAALGSGLIYWALKKAAHQQADYQAFAQSQGWQYDHAPATSGTADVVSFRDPMDDWTLRIIFAGSGANDGSPDRRVEWISPQGALEDGEAVLGMPLPAKTVAMLQSGGALGQQVLKTALKATYHALGKTRFNLTIDEASAGNPGGMVMASGGQARAMDAMRTNADLAAFRASHKAAEVPVIIRDNDGLKLRRPGAVKDLKDLSALVALGKSLRADLSA